MNNLIQVKLLKGCTILLKGYVLKRYGVTELLIGVKPDNNELVVLSEYGVNYIMQMLSAYLCENTFTIKLRR